MSFGLKEEAKDTDYLCQPADVESESQQKPKGRGEPGENQVSNSDDPKKSGRALKLYYIGQLHKSIQLSPLHVSGWLFNCPGCSMPAHNYWHSSPAVLGGDRYIHLHSLAFLLKLLLLLCSWIFNFSLNSSYGALKWLIIPLHRSLACSKIFHYSVPSGVAQEFPLTLSLLLYGWIALLPPPCLVMFKGENYTQFLCLDRKICFQSSNYIFKVWND